ncbi:MAG: hypothetical protein KDI22_13290, partial [Gammaproteobacteria bacterium]|nr:hypothetical protein [Gammaproteobacteria bacterium]
AGLAAVQATGVVDTDFAHTADAQLFAPLLDIIPGILCSALIAALAAIVTLVRTKEHMMRKITHTRFRTRLLWSPHYISHA